MRLGWISLGHADLGEVKVPCGINILCAKATELSLLSQTYATYVFQMSYALK